jgi:predicted membrane protein
MKNRIIAGLTLVICGIFLIISNFVFHLAFFPWILAILGLILGLAAIFSGNLFGGLQSILWLGGLCFAFYFHQIWAGLLVILGFSIIIGGIEDFFKKKKRKTINININDSSDENK